MRYLMCGIAGYVDWSGQADSAIVAKQLATLAHRGPDAKGSFGSGSGAVGQTRLSIIDLVSGDPPITNEDGTIGVSLNGEIYNYQALTERLSQRHRFSTACDTEVIAHLAESSEPVELARQLHGMFAIAVWDARRRRLILIRDRLGKKPLYYWRDSRRLVFGSEIKAVLAHPNVPADLNEDAIPAYLGFGYVPTPDTFFRGVRSVPPGHVLVADAGREPECLEYWAPRIPGPDGPARLDLSLDEAAGQLRERLSSAVRRRLIADVPLGAFLSGGIDSSAIVALMAQTGGAPPRTFTIGFKDDQGFDERPYARVVAKHLGTEHTEFVVEPHAVDLVDKLVWHHDQPFGDSSAIPTYLLAELTAGHVTVALCGDGGDELFAGYERFAAGVAASRLGPLPLPARRGLRHAARLLGPGSKAAKAGRFLSQIETGMPDAFRQWISYVPDPWIERLLPGRDVARSRLGYRAVWAATRGAQPLDRLLQLNIETYLLDDLLPKIDRMSMAHGLEVRAPFLDHELVEWALRLPPATKQRGLSLKRCLKAAVADLLPAELMNRPKHGFGVPLDRWFRTELAGYLQSMLGSRGARVRSHLDGDAVDAMLAEHQTGVSHGHALWTLLTLETFLRQRAW